MRELNSLIMKSADKNKIPAGGALAVDREEFSKSVHESIISHPLIKIINQEYKHLPNKSVKAIIATGPLTSKDLAEKIIDSTGNDNLAFFDAIAPIVYKESIDMNIAWFQSRYDKIGTSGDKAAYINCPLNKDEYIDFVNKLIRYFSLYKGVIAPSNKIMATCQIIQIITTILKWIPISRRNAHRLSKRTK